MLTRRTLAAGLLLSVFWIQCTAPAMAQDAEQPAATRIIEEIVVTGTRLQRRDTISPSPVATFDSNDLARAPQPTLEETLNRIPQLTPDFGRSSNNPGDGTARLNLRGIGSERTLVLLNGRRVAPSGSGSSVDINNIPQALVQRVEIISGGASAVYGSDALAGVVNFITHDEFDGVSLQTRYGVTDQGDANYTDISIAMGTEVAAGRGHVSGFLGYYDRDSLLADARERTEVTVQEDGAGGLFNAGSFSVPEGVLFNPVPGLGFPIFNADGSPRSFVNPDDQYNFAPFNYLQTPLTRFSAGVFASLTLNDSYELYAETLYTNNESAQQLAPVPLTEFVSINVDNPILAPATAQLFQDNFTNPAGPDPLLASFTVSRRLDELGNREVIADRDYWRSVVGIRGSLGRNWDIDGWISYTRSDEDQLLQNDGSAARFRQGLLVDPQTGQCLDPSGGCVPVDVFGPGRLSTAAANFLRYAPLRNTTTRTQSLASVFVSGTPGDTWAGPLDVAIGLEWRSDRVDFRADDVLFTGDTLGYNGDSPISGTEGVTEVYAEAIVPLVDDAAWAESLVLEVGARYSHYDDAGGAFTSKLGGSWTLNSALRVRAMQQRSVRAPNNQELFQRQFIETSNFVGNILLVDPCAASQDPVGNGLTDACVAQGLSPAQLGVFEAVPLLPVEFTRGGNTDLEPERAKTFTAGVIASPQIAGNFSLAVDYYDIEVTRSIGEIDARSICFDPANTSAAFCDRIQRITDPADPLAGNVFAVEELFNNRGLIATRGIDTQLRYETELPAALAMFTGDAQLSANVVWTHVLDLEFQGSPVGTVENCVGFFESSCTGENSSSTAADDRVSGSVVYSSGPLSLAFGAQWISGTTSYRLEEAARASAPAPTLAVTEIGSQFYLDADVGFRFSDTIALRFGVTNVLDKEPPLIPNAVNNTDTQLFDPFGRSYSLSLQIDFAR